LGKWVRFFNPFSSKASGFGGVPDSFPSCLALHLPSGGEGVDIAGSNMFFSEIFIRKEKWMTIFARGRNEVLLHCLPMFIIRYSICPWQPVPA
jgi:hypothetical protein